MELITRVYGLDLSLASTGVACVLPGGRTWTDTIKPKHTGHVRLDEIVGQVTTFVRSPPGAFVVVEGPIYHVPMTKPDANGKQRPVLRGYHERAGLWWAVTHRLHRFGIPCAVAPPANVKMFATGKGNASKDQVLATVARLFPEVDGNDEADALACAALGAQYLGHPLAEFPDTAYRVAAVLGVEWWPALEAAIRA